MSFRNTSGKFSLSSFRRQPSTSGGPESPVVGTGGGGGGGGTFHFGSPSGNINDEDFGPRGNDGPGLGKKLGNKIAHQSLLPSLGNQELRSLQSVITTEKGVLVDTERLAADTHRAATSLPALGAEEGPDLQDVLTHSSTLLTHLASALTVFVGHQTNMRVCYKRIRQREEDLDELRRRRRATGAKAESAEKKLAKMGPENKGLQGQTELLERLRAEMRQMDTDIVMEESKLGDFKRQAVKEALSLKFGGLEELGEKMCIIGELGKLLLEEIPLEETPPGYGRAPYTGYDKTENAVNEATRCLATVQFHAASSNPRPPGLPHHTSLQPLTAPTLPRPGPDRVAAAEEFANYPGNVASPETKGKGREASYSYGNGNGQGQGQFGPGGDQYRLDENPYGGYVDGGDKYRDFGGMRGNSYGSAGVGGRGVGTGTPPEGTEVVWQGPTEEALRAHQRMADSSMPSMPGTNGNAGGGGHDYEYEQQRQLDAEEMAWRNAQGANNGPPSAVSYPTGGVVTREKELPNPHEGLPTGTQEQEAEPRRSWEPLNVKRDRSVTPDPQAGTSTNHIIAPMHAAQGHGAGGLAPPVVIPPQYGHDGAGLTSGTNAAAGDVGIGHDVDNHLATTTEANTNANANAGAGPDPDSIDLPPPNPSFLSNRSTSNYAGSLRAQTPQEGFYTPMETPANSVDPIESLERLEAMEKTYSIDNHNHDQNPAHQALSHNQQHYGNGDGESIPLPSSPPLPPPPMMPAAAAGGGTSSGRNSPAFGNSPTSPTAGTYTGSGAGGKISAAAFRRVAKPRTASYASTAGGDPDATSPNEEGARAGGVRRLPVPPVASALGYGGEPSLADREREGKRISQQGMSMGRVVSQPSQAQGGDAQQSTGATATATTTGAAGTGGAGEGGAGAGGEGVFDDAPANERSPPPSYGGGHAGNNEESLR